MAPSSKKHASNTVALAAYVKAYLKPINWSTVFSRDVAGFLHKFAQTKNTTIDIVSTMLLLNTAALLGPRTVIKYSEDFKLHPNMYMIIVAKPGLGKTPAFTEICDKPLGILQSAINKKFKVDDFTRAGLMSSMEKNEGFLYVCGDELCHTLDELLQTDSSAFRKNLNQKFSGSGYSKEFATRASTVIKSSCLSILGTSQPGKFMDVLHKFNETDDGLSDRFLSMS